MANRKLSIFATRSDLECLLGTVERKREVEYVISGLNDAAVVERLPSLLNTPNLGRATNGASNLEIGYLVVDKSENVGIRKVRQRRGGMKYAIDQVANPKSVAFAPGGVFNNTTLIAGHVGSASVHPVSLELFQLFAREIRQQFQLVKSFYVGKEAREWLNSGQRLTTSVKSPTVYDLTPD